MLDFVESLDFSQKNRYCFKKYIFTLFFLEKITIISLDIPRNKYFLI